MTSPEHYEGLCKGHCNLAGLIHKYIEDEACLVLQEKSMLALPVSILYKDLTVRG